MYIIYWDSPINNYIGVFYLVLKCFDTDHCCLAQVLQEGTFLEAAGAKTMVPFNFVLSNQASDMRHHLFIILNN